jgi:DNA polymerase III epsilon subunit-like protein
MKNILILDTETTGLSSKDEVIELSYLPITNFNDIIEFSELLLDNETLSQLKMQRFLPSVKINSSAFKVHGIGFRHLLGKPKSKMILEYLPKADMYVGHNVKFDHRMLGRPDIALFCTWELFKKMDKIHKTNRESYKLDILFTQLYPNLTKFVPEKHSSEHDVYKVLLLLNWFIQENKGIKDFVALNNYLKLVK